MKTFLESETSLARSQAKTFSWLTELLKENKKNLQLMLLPGPSATDPFCVCVEQRRNDNTGGDTVSIRALKSNLIHCHLRIIFFAFFYSVFIYEKVKAFQCAVRLVYNPKQAVQSLQNRSGCTSGKLCLVFWRVLCENLVIVVHLFWTFFLDFVNFSFVIEKPLSAYSLHSRRFRRFSLSETRFSRLKTTVPRHLSQASS